MPGLLAVQLAMIGGAVVVLGVAVLLRDPAANGMMIDRMGAQYTAEHEVWCIGESPPG
ncbi:hypothetical protein GGS26DRAFT_591187 [Hypomontagnella submonticulosa]|nr:hypothetical protein GGS26DRAFT_591187 [Hypomontagnella submonticulosa]